MTISVEIQAVRDFIQTCPPFDQLPDDLVTMAACNIQIDYYRKGSDLNLTAQETPRLYIVRSGAFEIRNENDELLDRAEPGGYFGFPSLLTGHAITNHVHALEDGLVYLLNEDIFARLRASNRPFDRFFNQAHAKRLRGALRVRDNSFHLTQRLSELIGREPVVAHHTETVAQVAQRMTEQRVSAVMVVDDDKLCGLVTDRDLRARVLAENRDYSTQVHEIMTHNLATISADSLVFEATLLMTEKDIHHVPIVGGNGKKPIGMITATDLVRSQKSDPVYLIGELGKQTDAEGLQKVSRDIPELLRNLIQADATAEQIGRLLTSVTDALTRQLITQATEKLGPAPVPFVWLAFGSQGRRDQTAVSDQDNGLLISNNLKKQDAPYFQQLARHVNDGLNLCGYKYCPGDIMASTLRWRQPLEQWHKEFMQWIHQPSSKALMHASIFFDMRPVYGADYLFEELQQGILNAARSNNIFLAQLTANALQLTPPLGFFKNFVLEHSGEHKNRFDVKLRGIMPLTDLARIYALASGDSEISTRQRLLNAVDNNVLSLKSARNLLDAQEFISHLRLEHQGELLTQGKTADNHIDPRSLSSLVRHQLRDAFAMIVDAQSVMRREFTSGLM
ncbi:DUF294 nucleotidyltransferase-like domain-containing protein [Porticoccus sp. W117]|uniref:DUF294 nucleotidyltransferase-like domain-containing protein n=1 Tax=Porticoccus sp. W117 TaxID=3054777 RepID=UPI00259A49F7|nr:DUF294 nucleotidyltransferase-like domain-containing protein [Porticoccus sp. W117]MDM3869927.1 DUF294 nucleotidyltransferase-like domain-containing protein [Porticoccus sp. W117]